MASESEQALAARLAAGDTSALGPLLEACRAGLIAFIQRRMSDALKSKVDPEDVYQEVAISAVKAIDSVELNEDGAFGWFCGLAERRIVDAHRRHFEAKKRAAAKEVSGSASTGTSKADLIGLMVASLTSPSAAFSRNQRVFRMFAALESLSEEGREAIKLRYISGLGPKEIAPRIGKSEGATRVLLHRTLDKIQQAMGEEDAPHR